MLKGRKGRYIDHKLGTDELGLRRPDVLLYNSRGGWTRTQPVDQLLIIAERLEQRHGGVGVHVDQSGHDDVVQLIDHRVRSVLPLHFLENECRVDTDHLGGKTIDDLLSIDDDGVEVIDRVLGNDGHNPSRVDNQTDRSHVGSGFCS